MFVYEKKLQYPVKIATPMPYPELKGLLTDIGVSVPILRILFLFFLDWLK